MLQSPKTTNYAVVFGLRRRQQRQSPLLTKPALQQLMNRSPEASFCVASGRVAVRNSQSYGKTCRWVEAAF